jgi:hypothetical protein
VLEAVATERRIDTSEMAVEVRREMVSKSAELMEADEPILFNLREGVSRYRVKDDYPAASPNSST